MKNTILAGAALAFILSAATAAPASAQALQETAFATNTRNIVALSFGQDGRLYSAGFGDGQVVRAPAAGGGATSFINGTGGLSAVIGPDDALYVPTNAGTILRYAPGSTVADNTPYATGFPSDTFAIAFDAAGRLYGASGSGAGLRRAGATGGAATVLCSTIPSSVYGIVVTNGGVPLMVSTNVDPIQQCSGGVVSNFATVPASLGIKYSLTKDTAGNIYTATYSGSATGGHVLRAGPTGGAATQIARAASGSVIGLAFRGDDLFVGNYNASTVTRFVNAGGPGAQAVPTLSEWAMILFGTVLAGGAALYIQRRRFTV